MYQERICEGGEGFFQSAEMINLAEPTCTSSRQIYGHVVYTDISSMHVNFKVCTQHKVGTICNLRKCTVILARNYHMFNATCDSIDMLE